MQVYNDGLVKFNFPHINLPDSNSNEAASHGYVQYKIRAKDSLAIGSTIENTANIFFDFNPPIITNTTNNTVINCSIPPTIINATVCNSLNFELNGIIYSNSGTHSGLDILRKYLYRDHEGEIGKWLSLLHLDMKE